MKVFTSFFLFCIILSNKITAQCNAAFTTSTTGYNQITFNNLSTPSGTNISYTWWFGDGNLSTLPNPVHYYSSTGTYTVTLSMFNSINSCTSTSTQTLSIGICAATASFAVTNNGGGSYTFINTTASLGTNTYVVWNFGDGSLSNNLSTTTPTYGSNGNYIVSLTVGDTLTNFCTTTTTQTININSLPCSVTASFVTYSSNSNSYFFSNLTTPNSSNINYFWQFGDGTTANTMNASHTYANNNNYIATLTATEGTTSCTSSFTQAVGGLTTCSITANFTYTIGNNGVVNFSGSAIGNSINTPNFWWNINPNGTSLWGQNVSHAFQGNGTYYVTLFVNDSVSNFNSYCNDSITLPITISNVTCAIGGNIFGYVSTQSNGFTSFIFSPTNNLVNYQYAWNFGDGNTSTQQNPTHNYLNNGTYNVSCVITDSNNPTCSYTATTMVNVICTNFSVTPNFTYQNGTNGVVTFSYTSSGSIGIPVYGWNFGDGNSAWGLSNQTAVISNTYASNGLYNVLLTVVDSIGGCSTSTIIPVLVNNALGLQCSANPIFNLVKDFSQSFSWYGYPNYQTNVSSVTWNWGDGTTSNSFYPVHTYSAAGFYNICLTVSLSCGTQTTYCNTTNIYRTTQQNPSNQLLTVTIINNTSVGIKNNETNFGNSISVYPNPSNGVYKINIDDQVKLENAEVINLYGQVIKNIDLNKTDTFNLNEQPDGVYLLKINSTNKTKIVKLIKQ